MDARLLPLLLFGLLSLEAGDPAQNYIIQTVAGTDSVGDGGPALAAVFSQPEGIAVDRLGAVYVADADDNRVRKIASDGTMQTVAGTGAAGFSGDGGPASAALLNHPYGLALDAAGNLFIADLGNARVRKVDTNGVIQTIAGGGRIPPGGNGDGGPAWRSQLTAPRNLAFDSDGILYISDFGAHRVYRVSVDGILTTLAGNGAAGYSGDGAAAVLAQLNAPAGLAADALGAVYIADSGNNCIRRVYRDSILTLYNVAAPTGLALAPDGTLYIAAASYFGTLYQAIDGISPSQDVAADAAGNLYITTGRAVSMMAGGGAVTIIAGGTEQFYWGGDNGPAVSARLHTPSGLALDNQGNIFIADTANNRIRRIASGGVISTIAGTGDAGSGGDTGPATAAQLNAPRSVAVDAQNNLYIADTGNNRIRKVTTDGKVLTVAGGLNDPEHVAVGPDGAVYVADTGNDRVVKVDTSGTAGTFTQVLKPAAVLVDQDGNVFISEATRISRVSAAGVFSTVVDGLNKPRGLALTANGDLLIAEAGAHEIRSFSTAGGPATLAGTGKPGFSGDGGAASQAQLNAPADLAVDSTGTIWIADAGNNRIRTLTATKVGTLNAGAAMVSAATLAAGSIAPGEIVSIFGSGFDPQQTQLLFNGKPATTFYIGDSQINALAPADLAAGSTAAISISVAGSTVDEFSSAVVPASPGIFTLAGGTGQAAALNQDGSVNSDTNPAARESIVVLFATGQGKAMTNVGLTIGGYPAALLYAGPAPGFAGLMQINAQVPGGFLPPGVEPVVLSVNGATSQDGVTIVVR